MVAMILRNLDTVLHASPTRPRPNTILRRVPDALAPDNVFEIQSRSIVHNPLCDLAARNSRSLTHRVSVLVEVAHRLRKLTLPASEYMICICSVPTTMISTRRRRTITRPCARLLLTLPSLANTIFSAPSTATCLHVPIPGIVGAAYPPKPVAED